MARGETELLVVKQMEARRIVRFIHKLAEASDDPGCCIRMARKIADAVERGEHRA